MPESIKEQVMVELISNGVFLYHGTDIVPADSSAALDQQEVFNQDHP